MFGTRTKWGKTLIAQRQEVIKRRKPVDDLASVENAVKAKAIILSIQNFELYHGWIYRRHCRAVKTNCVMSAIHFRQNFQNKTYGYLEYKFLLVWTIEEPFR